MIAILAAVAAIAPPSAGPDFFKVSWANGVASFQLPGQKPLWSFGVDCTDTGTSRKDYRDSNPSYAAFKLFDSDKDWVDDTIQKLTKWGFNSTGGWSDDNLFAKYGGAKRLPYFVVLHLGAYNLAPWHDIFDPGMDGIVDKAARAQIPQIANDPYLVGYFSDNELGWWDDTIFLTYLRFPAASAGRKKLLETLRGYYGGSFTNLKKDWAVMGDSFDKITGLKLRPGTSGRKAVDAWTEVIGRRYYSLMRDAIRKYDRRHLILGDRYCQYYTLPIVRAARDYVDVISTNFGADWNDGGIAPFFLRTLHQLTAKPVIVTEFYMCARENRSGNKNSGTAFPVVDTQEERADSFSRYVRAVSSLPYTIGAHWFQFSDEPQNGRGDGENFNMGLVDTQGRPYERLVSQSAQLNLPSLRASARDSMPTSTVVVPQVSQVPLNTLKGWPRGKGVLPVAAGTPFGDLFVAQDSHYLYLALFAMDYMDEGLYAGGRVPEEDRNRWRVSLTGLSAPLEVRYGGKGRTATVNQPGIGVYEASGLKYTVILKIPLNLLRRSVPEAITSTADTHGRSSSMTWRAKLILSGASR